MAINSRRRVDGCHDAVADAAAALTIQFNPIECSFFLALFLFIMCKCILVCVCVCVPFGFWTIYRSFLNLGNVYRCDIDLRTRSIESCIQVVADNIIIYIG